MPLLDYLDNFIQEAQAQPLPVWELPAEPAYLYGNQRRLKVVDAPSHTRREWQDLGQFRQTVARVMREYMLEPAPEHMLLIPAPPGSGKTWAGVDFAHWVYETTKHRVLYAGPRRDFFADVLQTVVSQEEDLRLWYDWKPRRKDNENPDNHTCNHAESISEWLTMGYEGMDFCKRVCGFEYINNGCPYHAQKNRKEPLIYGNHLHVTLGHPLADQFAVVVGDELPLSAFEHRWTLPASRVQFGDIPFEHEFAQMIHLLNRLCDSKPDEPVSGVKLIEYLGGAERVISGANAVMADAFVRGNVIAPEISRDGNLDRIPANYLPTFLPILKREAEAVQAGQEYPQRLYVDNRGLTMLTRRTVDAQMQKHTIWFDATGTPELYETMFQRPVMTLDAQPKITGRIYQVTDRANGKSSLMQYGEATATETGKATQLRAQIDRICEGYTRPGIITYQQLEDSVRAVNRETNHFYGSRGTNQFEQCDVLVVAGTPMPPLYQIEMAAKCLWPERMRPFDKNFFAIDRPYAFVGDAGEGYAYPVSQFGDPDLNVLLWQYRDGELIQAAHRIRLLFRDVPVYLLSNLPLAELPPTRLLTIRDLFDAPEGVDVFGWGELMAWADERNAVGTKDLVDRFGLDPRTARKYVEILSSFPGWEPMAIKTGKGRPQTGAQKLR